ncbi:MAG: ATP-binding protein [Chloroflexota bacterium]
MTTVPTLGNREIHPPMASSRSIWDTLTQPAPTLVEDNKPRARLLSAVLLIFFPLSFLAIFLSPLIALMSGKVPNPPAPGTLVALALIAAGYAFSRSRYYSVGAWMAIITPLAAVLIPIFETGTVTSVVSLFFLSIAVIMAGLLLSSRETLIIGGILAVLVIFLPEPPAAGTTASPNSAVFSFILVTAGITALVGRNRENYVRLLVKSQSDLKQSLTQTEDARVQAEASRERAERSDQVKSAFLASMSHELRTPLNSIINFTRFVAEGDTGEVNDQQKDLLNEVIGSGIHLLNLINDVLDMSKIEAGSLNLFIEDNVSLESILNSTLSTGRSLLKDKDKSVKLEKDIDANLPLIRADRQRILQVLLNIVSNACKFTEEGEIRVSAKRKNDEVIISITDTGPGIAPEDEAVVFQAFKQTNTGLRQSGGTGLGMPIAKNLTEAHGGRLWLESHVGKGTTFYVALPVKSETLIPTLA